MVGENFPTQLLTLPPLPPASLHDALLWRHLNRSQETNSRLPSKYRMSMAQRGRKGTRALAELALLFSRAKSDRCSDKTPLENRSSA